MTETTIDRTTLREHLVTTRIAGDVATSRRSNTSNIRRMLDRDPHYTFGLELGPYDSYEAALAVMAERVGIDPDPTRVDGRDRIDPDLVIAGLAAGRELLADVVRHHGRVLFATGHPTGMLGMYVRLAAGVVAAGAEVTTAGDGVALSLDGEPRWIRYVGGVAVLASGADLFHTHLPDPMQRLLTTATADLVIADHGWAGAAATAGLRTIGFADCNDPALFIGAANRVVDVAVPLDDNVLPRFYDPLADHMLAGLSG